MLQALSCVQQNTQNNEQNMPSHNTTYHLL